MTSRQHNHQTRSRAPVGADFHIPGQGTPHISTRTLILIFTLLACFFVGFDILPPTLAPRFEEVSALSLLTGLGLALTLAVSRRQLPYFLTISAVFSFIIRWPDHPPRYASLVTISHILALVTFRWLALHYAGGDRRPWGLRFLLRLLAYGLVAISLAAITIVALIWTENTAGWLSLTEMPSTEFVLGTRLAAQSDGILTIGPLFLLFLSRSPGSWPRATWAEVGGWLVLMTVIGVVAIRLPPVWTIAPMLLLIMFAVLLFAVLRHGVLPAAVLTPAFAIASGELLLPPAHRVTNTSMPEPLEILPGQIAAFVAALLTWAVAVTVAERDVARARAESDRAAQLALTALQRALLPTRSTSVGGVQISSRYRAAEALHLIGGDWFDSIALPAGGTALVIGDVEGHDLQAASTMGLVRGAVRCLALEGHSPAIVLARVNAFLTGADTGRLVTMTYVQLYPGDTLATIAVAGHPAPLVVPPGGSTQVLQARSGPILGVDGLTGWEEQTFRLPREATLVLYTDGLVDFPSAASDQQEQLAALVSRTCQGSPDDIAETLISSAPLYDDAAVLVARLPSLQTGTVQRTFPAQAVSASMARVWLGDVFDVWRAGGTLTAANPDDDLEAAQLLLTELVSNAVRHSDDPVVVRLRLAGQRLRVEVEDTSERMPVLRHPEDAVTEGRGLRLVEALASDWGVQLVEHGKVVWFDLLDAAGYTRRASDRTASPSRPHYEDERR